MLIYVNKKGHMIFLVPFDEYRLLYPSSYYKKTRFVRLSTATDIRIVLC